MEGKNLTTARLAMEADANIIGSAFVVKPEKTLANRLGVIFGVVEIYNLNDIFVDRILDAISDLKTEYYLPPFDNKTPERRFEEALTRTNRRISAAISESVHPVDLRNLRLVMGLTLGSKVYLSHTGRSQALFFRQKKDGSLLILNILDTGEERPKPEPEKVFSNIISGEITPRDTLLLCNNEFLSLVSQNELGEMLSSTTVEEGSKKLETVLHSQPLKSNYYSVLLKSADLPSTAAAATPATTADSKQRIANTPVASRQSQLTPKESKPQSSINELLYTQVRTEQYLTPSLMPAWQKFFVLVFKYSKIGLSYLWRGLNIAIIWLGRKLYAGYNYLANQISKKRAAKAKKIISLDDNPLETEEMPAIEAEEAKASEALDKELTGDEFMSAPALMESDVEQAEVKTEIESKTEIKQKKSLLNWQEKSSSSRLAKQINGWINGLIEKFLLLNMWQKFLLIAGLILLISFSQSVVWIGRSSEVGSPRLSSTAKISNQIKSLVDNAEAQNIFNDEKGAYASLLQADELLKQIPAKRSNQATIDELKQRIDDVRRALRRETNMSSLKPLVDFSSVVLSANVVGLARVGKYFWVFDNSNAKFYRLDPVTLQWTSATSSIVTAKKLAAMDDKNLIVIAGDNSAYKLTLSDMSTAKFKPSKDYFNIKADLKTLIIDPPIASSTISQSAKDGVWQYFLDTTLGRLVILGDKNIFKRQYTGPFIKTGSSFVGSSKDKKFWVLSDNKLYQINWDF